MLESSIHQASGLSALSAAMGPRLMAVVSHGDERAELPLLWRLCLALANDGYAVTVLDATVCESEMNPGLEQLLECDYVRAPESLDAPAWNIVPSGKGIQTLCATPSRKDQNLRWLGRVFPADGVVILYSNAEWLVALMGDSHSEPLLTLSSMKNSLMTSYLALKRLLKNGNLRPTVVNLAHDHHAVAVSLGECARNFLGYEVKPINIAAPCESAISDGEVRSLALRLLESAVPLTHPQVRPHPATDEHPGYARQAVSH
jgi:hypothetical protein